MQATGAAIDLVVRRQFRAWRKQLFAIMGKIVAANLDSIRKWADSDPTDDDPHEKQQCRRGRKPKYKGFAKHGTEPDEPPLRIAGRLPSNKRGALHRTDPAPPRQGPASSRGPWSAYPDAVRSGT